MTNIYCICKIIINCQYIHKTSLKHKTKIGKNYGIEALLIYLEIEICIEQNATMIK